MEELTVSERKAILEILQANGRASPEQIGVMLGLDPTLVEKEIKNMENEKVILGYKSLINWEKTGVEKIVALIEVKVTPQRDVGFDRVAERIYRYPQVTSVYLLSGTYDLSVVVEGESFKDVALFVAEKLAPLEFVSSTTTHFILRKYKQDGFIFEDKEEDRRLVVTP